MARIARVVIPDYPHHIIQRGNRRQNVFFNDQDKEAYIAFLAEQIKKWNIEIWAYCLMDNHVHLIALPKDEDGLARGIGETHRRYTRMINFRKKWRGYLWQGRFISYPLDEKYLCAAMRYIELNPVRAALTDKAEDYPWSSARSHVLKEKDVLLSNNFMVSKIDNWASYLAKDDDEVAIEIFRKHARTGRPLGDQNFINELEKLTGRMLQKQKPGPKSNSQTPPPEAVA
ncbi:MAG: transposase [Candidatus Omnitrophica bacterium]|nr:transposase [Candidatus Omnitrophota bacterium]MBU1127504.1 transposase [Candidatus Omnitrophota bacterium]MBU1785184.1 transposase [Candidatus Omnitrophota bacterium]MBU1851521.1 transposase [Candidatus Omnitrophota bacterium]